MASSPLATWTAGPWQGFPGGLKLDIALSRWIPEGINKKNDRGKRRIRDWAVQNQLTMPDSRLLGKKKMLAQMSKDVDYSLYIVITLWKKVMYTHTHTHTP